MLLKSINYQSDDRRHALDHVQQVFTECFDHVDNLEALVICLSNMIQKALWGWIRQIKQCNHQIQCHLYWSPSTFQLLWLVAKLPEHSDGSVPRLARLLNDRSRSQVASMKPYTTGKHITSFYQSKLCSLWTSAQKTLSSKYFILRQHFSPSIMNRPQRREWKNEKISEIECAEERGPIWQLVFRKVVSFLLEMLLNLSVLTVFHLGWMWKNDVIWKKKWEGRASC